MRSDLMPYMTTDKRPTKRIVLSCIMSLFDPLGLLSPYTIHGKDLLQDTWRSGCTWDEQLNDECYEKWCRLRAAFTIIEKIKIPRCYLRDTPPSAPRNIGSPRIFGRQSGLLRLCSLLQHHSSWNVKMFSGGCENQVCSIDVPLKQEEYELAEQILWKQAQRDCYKDEVTVISKNQELSREEWLQIEKSSPLYKQSPFLDEYGVLRMDGRLRLADFVPYDTRFPTLLPRNHIITYRLIESYHQRYGHANKETVFNELRRRFSIPKLRICVAQVMKNCQWCKVHKTKPEFPRMAPLPAERLVPFVKPFSYVGIDYFGPIDVTVGRRTEKRWIVLFTCLNVRAVHLEVAYRLNTESCIMAIRRFVVRRGPPIVIFSDNGTNFKAANRELQEQIQRIDASCANVFTNARTRWSFNPPSAPHMGGVWERMVRSVKEMMSTLNNEQRLNDEILLTVISEAEEIVNARPLVYVPQDSDTGEAITPNHFLRGISSELENLSITPTNEIEALRNTYHRSQIVADRPWKRWLNEYLPSLNARSKWLEESRPLNPGDLVFVVDDHGRNGWIRGKVEEVIQGRDGRIRQAMVRTSTGVFKRPVSKLALIEVKLSSTANFATGR
ncbi:uncharacterized protein LOC129766140 [Toxorhynchites rutilus septentrionalis]|uniref:uncharacterized protein LOC129766140 n=1 Tax=Toxorhynchites rutilus septentrionalis TaxID=329112 RepID=UPI002479B735|nr:uncharacterized protein LOC129766140 [Toxorhynchites rutilus septentrionalis]